MSIKNYDRNYAKRKYKDIHNGSMKRRSNRYWCIPGDIKPYDGKVKSEQWIYCLHNGFENYYGSSWKKSLKLESNRHNRRKTRELICNEEYDEIPSENYPVYAGNPYKYC